MNNIGHVCFEQAMYEDAKRFFSESLKISTKLRSPILEAKAKYNLGILQKRLFDTKGAILLLQDSHRIYEELGDERMKASVNGVIAGIFGNDVLFVAISDNGRWLALREKPGIPTFLMDN